MNPTPRLAGRLFASALVLAALPARAGTLQVVSTSPTRLQGGVTPTAAVSVTFDRPLATASVTAASFRVFGRSSGPVSGPFTFTNGNQTATLTPSRPFAAGEPVYVNLSETLTAADASTLRTEGYAYQFGIAAGPALRDFDEIDVLDTRTSPGTPTRSYGGVPTDLDLDGWIDLGIVNEDSEDLRVFLNRGDGSGLYDPFLTPPAAIGEQASPNEPADFNNDGFPDVVTANVSDNSFSVVLGNGDGTFDPQQMVGVGGEPHGVVVLDVDGDGDLDIATSNTAGNNISLSLNNGAGVFGASASFNGGGDGEYPLAAGDMNNDGIFDLVVGTRNDQQVRVLLGNGNGTFTHHHNRAAGGQTWMIVLGDLDGDGNLDVTSANGASANMAVLLGNGDGTLDPATVVAGPGSMVATDLGDLDGDGDLDWVWSSFGGSRWDVYTNNGTGVFTFDQQFPAPDNASCALLLDFDRDSDLDLALVDEIADVVVLLQNSGGGLIFADDFDSGNTGAWSQTVP